MMDVYLFSFPLDLPRIMNNEISAKLTISPLAAVANPTKTGLYIFIQHMTKGYLELAIDHTPTIYSVSRKLNRSSII